MASTSDIRNGLCIKYNNDIYKIIEFLHVKPGKGPAFVRTKLALTEIIPAIKPYKEAVWANLIDGNNDSILDSLFIIKGVHARWALLLNNLSEADLKREYYHPENNKKYKLNEVIAIYSWHCNHHLAHIEQALLYKNQF